MTANNQMTSNQRERAIAAYVFYSADFCEHNFGPCAKKLVNLARYNKIAPLRLESLTNHVLGYGGYRYIEGYSDLSSVGKQFFADLCNRYGINVLQDAEELRMTEPSATGQHPKYLHLIFVEFESHYGSYICTSPHLPGKSALVSDEDKSRMLGYQEQTNDGDFGYVCDDYCQIFDNDEDNEDSEYNKE